MGYSSAVALTVREIARAGIAVGAGTVTPTGTHGNKFVNDGRTCFYVENGSASPITLTIDIPSTVDGQAVTDRTVTINATADVNGLDKQLIGPFPPEYNQSDGYVWGVCSATTDVKISAIRMPKVA